jgi:hypothetical protein
MAGGEIDQTHLLLKNFESLQSRRDDRIEARTYALGLLLDKNSRRKYKPYTFAVQRR